MNELLLLFVGFLLGILAFILKNYISDSRKRDSLRKTLIHEIQANYNQISDGMAYSHDKKLSLKNEKLTSANGTTTKAGDVIVINSYKFTYTVFESNVSNMHLFTSNTAKKIYHFYHRLRALESVAETALKLFEEAGEIKHRNPKYDKVKPIDAATVNGHFKQQMSEYELFERLAHDSGAELFEILDKI